MKSCNQKVELQYLGFKMDIIFGQSLVKTWVLKDSNGFLERFCELIRIAKKDEFVRPSFALVTLPSLILSR